MKISTGAASYLHVNLYAPTTPIAGQQFDYAFDDIGNRQTTTRDGRQATYSPNNLNQYTSRTVPGFVNVLGTATNTATVSLWSQDNLALYTPTTRKGDYFRGEMLVNNNTGALWLTITNVAVLSNYTGADIVTNIAGNLLLAKNPEVFTYDADGNLTSDSLWTNTWNGKNRRITIESRSTLPAAAKVKEAWTILADGRWIERIVSTNNGTSVLGNLMFGMIAKYAGQNLDEITKYVNGLKSGAFQTPDPYDAPVYKVGFDVFPTFDPKDDLSVGGKFCTKLLDSAKAQSVSLEWLGNGGTTVITRESCRPCDAKTTATQHGGGFKVTIND